MIFLAEFRCFSPLSTIQMPLGSQLILSQQSMVYASDSNHAT